jgi:tRNA-2-methylthio-N6-dimethylallyladenosine synthase
MIDFMLHDAGMKLGDGAIDRAAGRIDARVAELPVAWHQPAHARNGQTALPTLLHLRPKRRELGIDENGERDLLGVGVARVGLDTEYDNPEPDPDLRRRKTRSIKILHGVPHIAQQAVEFRRAERGHRVGDLKQSRIAHSQNFTDCHRCEYLSGLFSVSLRRAMSGLVYIKTFGCQMNEYDSSKMQDVLEAAHGMTRTDDPAEADVLLVNTCSVREKAQEKVFSLLGEWRAYKQLRPHVVIGVGGCVASQEGEGITARAPFVDLVFGPQTLHRLPEMIEGLKRTGRPQIDVSFPEIEKFDRLPEARASGATAFVSIMEGCSKYCTFCVVPYTRGEEISRPFAQVLAEAGTLAAQGVREITLLGQNVNAYAGGMDDGGVADLATLIHFVAAVPGVERIRFTTSHPLEFNDSLIEAYASVPKLNNMLHLPVQSGSDRVLAAMKRGHTALEYKQKLRKLRAVRPDVTITTDIIVGFPGETDEDFMSTMSLIADVGFDQSFSFIYSRRPGTPAASFHDEVPSEVKQRRLDLVQQRLNAQARAISERMVGSRQRVLIERPAKRNKNELAGRTDNNRWVNFDGPATLMNRFADVIITEARPNSLRGRLATDDAVTGDHRADDDAMASRA